MEYKVSCNHETNCGYVMVNLDGTDAKVPMASFDGKSISEQMENIGNNKNYYFDIFEQFSVSDRGEINSVNPENKILNSGTVLRNGVNMYSRRVTITPLHEKFKNLQKEYSETKDKNVKIQRELETERLNLSQKNSMMRHYNNQRFISSNISKSCKSPTPCYHQGGRNYPDGKNGPTGCAPTALSIVLGYYDRNGYPNILRNVVAPASLNSTITNLQTELGRLMGTNLSSDGQGSTSISNIPNGWGYLNGKYNYTSDSQDDVWYNWNNFLDIIKQEINNGRPIVITYESEGQGHSIVGHGYKGDSIYANFGWGPYHANKSIDVSGKSFTGYKSGKMIRLDTLIIR